jgi:hypothetical protein
MGTDEDPGTDLFENERKRRSELETSLLAVAASHLRDGGIQVVKESEDEITFWFNGGKFESGGCPTKNFFMVEIVVCTHEKGCHTEDTVLGVVDDARLPQALTNAAMSSLDEFIGQRAAYRRQTKK